MTLANDLPDAVFTHKPGVKAGREFMGYIHELKPGGSKGVATKVYYQYPNWRKNMAVGARKFSTGSAINVMNKGASVVGLLANSVSLAKELSKENPDLRSGAIGLNALYGIMGSTAELTGASAAMPLSFYLYGVKRATDACIANIDAMTRDKVLKNMDAWANEPGQLYHAGTSEHVFTASSEQMFTPHWFRDKVKTNAERKVFDRWTKSK